MISPELRRDLARARPSSQAYSALEASLDEYVRRMYSEWISTIESGIARFLESYLMIRSTTLELQGKTGRERYGFVEQVRLLRIAS